MAVIQFLWSEGVKGAEIHRRLSVQYEDSTQSRTSVIEWIEKFKSGWTIDTKTRSIRPASVNVYDGQKN